MSIRMLEQTTSQVRASATQASWSSGRLRSSATDFLFLLYIMKSGPMPGPACSGHEPGQRMMSPPPSPGLSTLITSAPMSPSSMVA